MVVVFLDMLITYDPTRIDLVQPHNPTYECATLPVVCLHANDSSHLTEDCKNQPPAWHYSHVRSVH